MVGGGSSDPARHPPACRFACRSGRAGSNLRSCLGQWCGWRRRVVGLPRSCRCAQSLGGCAAWAGGFQSAGRIAALGPQPSGIRLCGAAPESARGRPRSSSGWWYLRGRLQQRSLAGACEGPAVGGEFGCRSRPCKAFALVWCRDIAGGHHAAQCLPCPSRSSRWVVLRQQSPGSGCL